MKYELETTADLFQMYPQIMTDLVKVLVKNGKKPADYLQGVNFFFNGFRHRIFAYYADGRFSYIPGKPGIYLKNDPGITVMDDDVIMVENTDTNASVIQCEKCMLYAYQLPCDLSELTNDGNRGWNDGCFIMTFAGSRLEKQLLKEKGSDVMMQLAHVLEDYGCAFDSENSTTLSLLNQKLGFYSAKPYEKRRRANQLPLFHGVYETWKALTENNNTGSWCYMAYEFDYHGSQYTLTSGNLVEYDLFYRDANEKIRRKLEKMGAENITFISKKVM